MTPKALKILVLVDVQKDFIDGALSNDEAQKVVPNIVKKINEFDGDIIFATLDTHTKDYINTKEGEKLPVVHCVSGTDGWRPNDDVAEALKGKNVYFIPKPTFGSVEGMYGDQSLPEAIIRLKKDYKERPFEIEICGFVSEICVLHNAIILKAFCYDFADIYVDSSCCAGLTKKGHEEAMDILRIGQINVI